MNNKLTYLTLKEHLGEKKLVIFGGGIAASEAIHILASDGIPVAYICDNDNRKQGKKLFGIMILSPEVLSNEKSDDIELILAIQASKPKAAVTLQLYSMGIKNVLYHDELINFNRVDQAARPVNVVGEEFHIDIQDRAILGKISTLFELMEGDDFSRELLLFIISARVERNAIDWDFVINTTKIAYPSYFSYELFGVLKEREIIVCGGLGDAGDFKHFYKVIGGKLIKAYGFEASPGKYAGTKVELEQLKVMNYRDRVMENINEVMEIKLYPYALSDQSSVTCVINGGEISCASIDETVDKEDEITLIKLDIEGAELAALKGASQTILKWKPRLIVCLYHRPDDLWEIPFFIHNLCPAYKLYIRPHHGMKSVLELHAIYEN